MNIKILSEKHMQVLLYISMFMASDDFSLQIMIQIFVDVLIILLKIIEGPVQHNLSLVLRKPVFGVSDQVQHKLGCTTTEDV